MKVRWGLACLHPLAMYSQWPEHEVLDAQTAATEGIGRLVSQPAMVGGHGLAIDFGDLLDLTVA